MPSVEEQNCSGESLSEPYRAVTEERLRARQLPHGELTLHLIENSDSGSKRLGSSQSMIKTDLGKRLQRIAEEVAQMEMEAECKDEEMESLRRELATSRRKWMVVGNMLLWEIERLRTENAELKKISKTAREEEALLRQIRELREELSDARQAEGEAKAVMKEQLGKARHKDKFILSLQDELEMERTLAWKQAEWAKEVTAMQEAKVVLLEKKAKEDIEKAKLEAAAWKEKQKMLAEEFFTRMRAT